MNVTLNTSLTVEEVCKGFVYNELEGKGLFGLSGKLVIQPEYQRSTLKMLFLVLKLHCDFDWSSWNVLQSSAGYLADKSGSDFGLFL